MTEKDLVTFYLNDIREYEFLERDEELELLKRAQDNDEEAREKLILCDLKLVIGIAKKYLNRGISFVDLISEGNIGLIHAIEKFDVDKGFRFSTYAVWWIKQSLGKSVIDKGRNIRIPSYKYNELGKVNKYIKDSFIKTGKYPSIFEISEKLNIKIEKVQNLMLEFQEIISINTPIGEEIYLEDTLSTNNANELDEKLIKEFEREEINKIIEKLNEREQKIIKLRYGFDGNNSHSLESIGKSFNITRERVRQIEKSSLAKLKNHYREQLKNNKKSDGSEK